MCSPYLNLSSPASPTGFKIPPSRLQPSRIIRLMDVLCQVMYFLLHLFCHPFIDYNNSWLIECAIALSPTVVSCTNAAAKGGAGMCCRYPLTAPYHSVIFLSTDPFTDAGCLASSLNYVVNSVGDYLPSHRVI